MVVTVPTSSTAKRGRKLSRVLANSAKAFFSVETRPLLRLLMGDGCLFDHATETLFERRKVSGDTPRNFATTTREFNARDQFRHSFIANDQMRTQYFTDNALDLKSNRRRQIKRASNRHRFLGN